MDRIKYIKIKETIEEHKPSNNVVECVEKGRFCMGKFIPTRNGQTDTCLKCMEMLGEEPPLIIKKRSSKNIWS